MKKLLIVVDYQNDFVSGSLALAGADKLEEPIAAKIRAYRALGDQGQIIFTMDTHDRHYRETLENKYLPVVHCLEGEDGWQLYGSINALKESADLVFSKPTFGSYELCEYLRKHDDEYESIEFVGVMTNICVLSNIALAKAAIPNVPILVDASCVGCGDEGMQEKTLDVMESLHVEVKR